MLMDYIYMLTYLYACSVASVVSDFATPRTVAHLVPLSVGFSRQEHWSGLPFPLPGDLLHPGIDPGFPALQVDSLPREPPDKPPLSSRKSYRA